MNLRDSLLAVLVAVVWGLNFVVIDWGMQDVPPLLFVAVRFVVVVFPAVLLVRRPQVPLRTLLAVGGFMSLGQFGLLYASIAAGMPPGLASLVLQAQVVLTIVIAAGALREWPTGAQVVGVALGTVGLLVVGAGRGGDVPLLALLLCVAAALSWAVGNVVVRSAGVVAGLSLTVWSALVVPLPALALAVLVHGGDAVVAGLAGWSWQASVSTLYTAGLASLVGYGIFNGLLARWPSSAVVPWILLVPVVGMGSAWLLVDEVPNAAEAIGGAILLAGVLVALRPRRRPRSAAAEVELVGR